MEKWGHFGKSMYGGWYAFVYDDGKGIRSYHEETKKELAKIVLEKECIELKLLSRLDNI